MRHSFGRPYLPQEDKAGLIGMANALACRTSNCINCGKTDLGNLFDARDFKRPHDTNVYSVSWCRGCSLGTVDFQGSDNSDFFNVPYYTHSGSDATFTPTILTRIAWRFDRGRVLDPKDIPDAKTLCDIGCGDGTYLKQFSEAGYRVTGVEPDPIAKNIACRYGAVFAGTAEILPTPVLQQRFDVVLMSHVLDACVDPDKALLNAIAILDEGGTLVVEVPNCASLGFRFHKAKWPWVDIPRHLTFFTETSLRGMFERAGLTVEEVHYLGYTRQFKLGAGWPWLARTAFASTAAKYDSLRIHATRRPSA